MTVLPFVAVNGLVKNQVIEIKVEVRKLEHAIRE